MIELTAIMGYIGAIVIGVSLGFLGGGGSILTVPVLVYFMQVEPVLATAYSLFVVGVASFAGSIRYLQRSLVDFKTGLVFAIPSFLAVYLTRAYLLPALPEVIWDTGLFTLDKGGFIMVVFALMMIAAAASMIGDFGKTRDPTHHSMNYPLVIGEGLVVGALTGWVGAGGGFLIIPALVVLVGLPMKLAIGTCLFIITIKSLIGFTGDIAAGQSISWGFLLLFTGLAVGGIFGGSYLSRYINNQKLKPIFGWFILVMGIYIMARQAGV